MDGHSLLQKRVFSKAQIHGDGVWYMREEFRRNPRVGGPDIPVISPVTSSLQQVGWSPSGGESGYPVNSLVTQMRAPRPGGGTVASDQPSSER